MKAEETTIEISAKHHAALLALAAKRGEKRISAVLAEAIEEYLQGAKNRDRNRKALLSLEGCLSREEEVALRDITMELRRNW
jgi:hypothetical protein